MISKVERRQFLMSNQKLPDCSKLGFFFLILILYSISEAGGDNRTTATSFDTDHSNLNGDSSICRVVRNAKKVLLNYFQAEYAASETFCDLSNHCTNVTCSTEFKRGIVNAGLILNLCEEVPEAEYWVNVPGQWDQPWVHKFSSRASNGKEGPVEERVEITGNQNGTTEPTKRTRWFIKNLFSITNGRNTINHSSKYINILRSELLTCDEIESNCKNVTLINFPRLPQGQLCDFSEITPSSTPTSQNDGGDKISTVSSSRSSRNANAWNPQEFHRAAAERASKFQTGQGLKVSPGESCDTKDIFVCGTGFTCVTNVSDGSGVCQCLPGHSYNATSGTCFKTPQVNPTDDPSSSADSNSNSLSSALGAIVSILVLVGIAAGIFFGTKYHVFSRLRHRIPVLRCWPFRRSQPWEDSVTMVERF